MAEVQFSNGSQTNLDTLPLTRGQVIFARDNNGYMKIYLDDVTSDNDAQVIRYSLSAGSGGGIDISDNSQYVPLTSSSGSGG